MSECVVCGARTRGWVTLIGTYEQVAVCDGPCRRKFLCCPIAFVGIEMDDVMQVATLAHRSPLSRRE